MGARIEEELNATGVAQVIVVLKQPRQPSPVSLESRRRSAGESAALAASVPTAAAAESIAETMKQYFVASARSQGAALARAVTLASARRGAGGGGRRGGSRGGGRMAKPLTTGVGGGRRSASLDELMAGDRVPAMPAVRVFPHLGIMLGTVNAQTYADLKGDDHVASVNAAPEFSLIRPVASEVVRPKREVTWGLDRLGIPEMWDAGLTGRGVLVGHLDTGADGSHPALDGAIKHFANFDLLGNERALPVNQAWDTATHGTHTAGTIAGRAIGNAAFGVAPEAGLASAIVIEGGNVVARILGGMNWAVGKGVRILNMSLGLRGYHADFLPVTQVLRARNVLPVFAVGNEGPGTSRSPGNYAECLSVGASGPDDGVADFSSSQSFSRPDAPMVPDLVAPGVDVISCVPGGAYEMKSGSSMATPHIAGLAALLLQAKNGATEDEVEEAIFRSCDVPPGMFPERGGLGIPNGPRAFEILTGSPLSASAGAAFVRGSRAGRPAAAARSKAKPAKKPAVAAGKPAAAKRSATSKNASAATRLAAVKKPAAGKKPKVTKKKSK